MRRTLHDSEADLARAEAELQRWRDLEPYLFVDAPKVDDERWWLKGRKLYSWAEGYEERLVIPLTRE
jgi:hypothetical protein